MQVPVSGVAGDHDEQQRVGVPSGGVLDCLLHFRDVLAGNRHVSDEKAFTTVQYGIRCV